MNPTKVDQDAAVQLYKEGWRALEQLLSQEIVRSARVALREVLPGQPDPSRTIPISQAEDTLRQMEVLLKPIIGNAFEVRAILLEDGAVMPLVRPKALAPS